MQTTPDMKGSSAGGAVLKFPVKQVNPYDQNEEHSIFLSVFSPVFSLLYFFWFPFA